MALGLNKTKRRIASVTSTQKITKAMGMVATVKLKRFQDAFENDHSYVSELQRTLSAALHYDPAEASHYAKVNEEAEGNLYILITSNLGLCAAYNSNLYSYLSRVADPEKDTILPLGNKGRSHLPFEGKYKNIRDDFKELDLSLDLRLIERAALVLKDDFNQKKYKRIYILYTQYVNSLRFVPSLYQLLPLDLPYEPSPEEAWCPPLFEPGPRKLIHLLMPQYLGALFYAKSCEAQLSEQAARRNAMDTANDNADELLNKLTIEYNKARQAAITNELNEIVSGANALKG